MELLLVVVILGVIAALSAAAYIAVMGTARASATEAMMRMVSDSLNERVESYMASTRGPTYNADANSTNIATVVGSSQNSRRAKVLARIEGMRAAFPQEFREFVTFNLSDSDRPIAGEYGYSLTTEGPITNYQRAFFEILDSRKNSDDDYRVGSNYVDLQAYKQVLVENESAECLYLILRHYAREAMAVTIDDIPARMIQDTDGDGFLEIVDGWGNPVRFYRWPTDLIAYYIEVEQTLPKTWMGVSNIDPDGTLMEDAFHEKSSYSTAANDGGGRSAFENVGNDAWPDSSGSNRARPRYYRLHAAYSNTSDPSSWPHTSFADQSLPDNRRSYPVIPVVVSAGPDGLFGMHLEPATGGGEPTDLSVRCGRVDASSADTLEQFSDNIVSLKQRSGVSQ